MLDAGEPIDKRDDSGCTALHFAADRGSMEAARLLISAGADINAQDADGQTPMHYACITENREVRYGLHERYGDLWKRVVLHSDFFRFACCS